MDGADQLGRERTSCEVRAEQSTSPVESRSIVMATPRSSAWQSQTSTAGPIEHDRS
jgi:hypothetical protein